MAALHLSDLAYLEAERLVGADLLMHRVEQYLVLRRRWLISVQQTSHSLYCMHAIIVSNQYVKTE